jgi:hypothetical protein
MGSCPRPDLRTRRPLGQRLVDVVGGRAEKIIDIALPRPLDFAAIRPEQRHEHRSQRKLALLGSSRQIAQIAASRVDVASLFENAGNDGGPIFWAHNLARLLIGRWRNAERRAHHDRGRHQVAPAANSAGRPIVGNLRAGAQHHS